MWEENKSDLIREALFNKNGLQEGDVIFVEQAWKDERGHYHDEYAEITAIKENGELELNWLWADARVRKFLKGTGGYMANDYKREF